MRNGTYIFRYSSCHCSAMFISKTVSKSKQTDTYMYMYSDRQTDTYMYSVHIHVHVPEFLTAFEAWAKLAQKWLVCAPLRIHLEPIN